MKNSNNANGVPQTEPINVDANVQAPPAPMPDSIPEGSRMHGQYGVPHHPMPGAPLMCLTGGMKFGWAATAFLLGPVAILLAWLTNLSNGHEARNEAIKYSVIGFVAQLVIGLLVMTFFGMTACAAIGALDPANMLYYY